VKNFFPFSKILFVLLSVSVLSCPGVSLAQKGGGKMGGGKMMMMKRGGQEESVGNTYGPMHPLATRDLQESTGLVKTGLRPVYPQSAECLEVKSFFADETRFDGSFRYAKANHGYHGGFDISADIGTPLIAIADGEIVHKYVGGRLVGKQIFLRHSPQQTGLGVWVYSKYKHFDKMPDLEIGDRVKMGQFLGPSGDSGTDGGHFPSGYSHLHMSIYTSASPDFETKMKAVVPKDVRQLDPVALYLKPLPQPLTSQAARDLADEQKDVVIPYKTTDGKIVPEGTKLIWPFPCKTRK